MTLTSLPAPFPPLVSGGEGLDRFPEPSAALTARLSQVYGVPGDWVLPVRGVTHGVELVLRMAARDGLRVVAPNEPPFADLSALYPAPQPHAATAAVIVRAAASLRSGVDEAARIAPALLVIDEGAVEFGDADSAAVLIADTPNLVVLRSLSLAYGLAGARVGAVLAQPATLARLSAVMEPYALPEVCARLALQALHPSRVMESGYRIHTVRQECARVAQALAKTMKVDTDGLPRLTIFPNDPTSALAAMARFGVDARRQGEAVRIAVSARADINDRLLAALGAPPPAARPARTGQAVRDTRETRIVCAVDLERPQPVEVRTGVGFFDHMLEQVAAHGGFSLRLACEGDLHTDPHHSVEDSAIALGQALKQALGERRGIARYGFVLPMDEAEARVSIDLSGRPYAVFEGAFDSPYIGEYRTDMTAHVMRSLTEHLGAAIHVAVTGQDDHHKTEAVFKALGRALRQAIRVEGDVVPSTKGVL